jgi:tRNA pseudouridine55 synthase
MQTPPAFSAKKVGGVPSYRLARKGQAAVLDPVAVTVHAFELLWVEGSRAGFTASVSSGTYIRALVHDLGERTGFGAHVEELRRTALGEFGEKAAPTLGQLEERPDRVSLLIPLSELLPEIAAITLDAEAAARVTNGRDLELNTTADRLRLFGPEGSLLTVAERMAGSWFHPLVVLGNPQRESAIARPEVAAPSPPAGSL